MSVWIAVVNAELLLFEGGKITAGACLAKEMLWTCKASPPESSCSLGCMAGCAWGSSSAGENH